MATTTVTAELAAPAADGGVPDGLVAEWEDLADRCGASPFVRPDWIAAWSRAFGPGGLEMRVLRRGERLAGVLALVRRGHGLASPTNAHTPHFGPLAEDAAARDDLLAAALAEGGRLGLDFLGDDDAEAAIRAARRAGAVGHVTTVLRSPWVDLAAPDGRPRRRFLADLRRRRRRLAERGEVTFVTETGPAGVADHLAAGLALEAAGWKGGRRTAVLQRPVLLGFYRDLAERAAARGHLRLFSLRLDGAPVAFALGLVQGGALHLLKAGFDPGLAATSPGQLLLADAMEQARAEGLARVELLGNDEPYKLAWTSRVRERHRVEIFPGTPSGRLARSVLSHRGELLAAHPGLAGALRGVRDSAVLPLLEEARRRRRSGRAIL
jgi:CelD/BcsL family acetyltransferase involved in cellulose biosynthesis